MKDPKKNFKNIEQMLKKSSWFADGWEIFNRGAYMQLYKENWYNQNQGGIHFETYLEPPQIKKKRVPDRNACRRRLSPAREIYSRIFSFRK